MDVANEATGGHRAYGVGRFEDLLIRDARKRVSIYGATAMPKNCPQVLTDVGGLRRSIKAAIDAQVDALTQCATTSVAILGFPDAAAQIAYLYGLSPARVLQDADTALAALEAGAAATPAPVGSSVTPPPS